MEGERGRQGDREVHIKREGERKGEEVVKLEREAPL